MGKFDVYELKKTLWKGSQIFIVAGLGGLVSFFSGLPATETTVFAIALFAMLKNFVKNYDW